MPRWVSYARGNEALARMEHLLRHPPRSRMRSMLLYEDSDSGNGLRMSVIALGTSEALHAMQADP